MKRRLLHKIKTSIAWNISTAVFNQSFSVSLSPTHIFFKPDGLKMYISDNTSDQIDEYDLSISWDISTAVFNQSFSVLSQTTIPTGLFFKPDGLKMYIIDNVSDRICEYNLSTAWNISTAVFNQSFSVLSQTTIPNGLFFKPDGLKMYISDNTSDQIDEYDLSISWDISTAVFNQSFSVSAEISSPFGLFFKPDGLKMYIIDSASDDVNEYNLSISWDISTAVFNQSFSVLVQDNIAFGLFFKPDGLKMYVTGDETNKVYEYNL